MDDQLEAMLREEEKKTKMVEDAEKLESIQKGRERAAREAQGGALPSVTTSMEELALKPGAGEGKE